MKKFIGFFLVNGAAQFFLFAAMLLLSKHLGPSEFGAFSYFYATVMILHQVMDFGLSTTYVNKVAALESSQILAMSRRLYSFRVLTVAGMAIFLLLLSFLPSSLYTIIGLDLRSILIIGFGAICHLMFNVGQINLQSRKKLTEMAAVNALLNLIRLFLVFFVLQKVEISSGALIFMFFAPSIVLFVFQSWLSRPGVGAESVSTQTFSMLVKSGLWVMFSSLAVMLLQRLDVLMLKALSDTYQVGIYSAASTLVSIFPFITGSVMMVLLPSASDLIRTLGVRPYCLRVLRFAFCVLPFIVLVLLASKWIFAAIYDAQYGESVAVFRILCLAHSFAIFINPISLVFYQKNQAYWLTLMNYIQLCINFLLNLWFVPKFGAEGAAFSTLGVYLFSSFFVVVAVFWRGSPRFKKS